ncbi:MAG TPA: hypothetical protein VK623_06060, partial [Flavobacterium sp.]|nr:hypothetical protein [Flavobacterium sp.]
MKKAAEKGFLYLIPLLFTFPLFKESISSFFFILLSANAILYSILSKNYKTANWKRALLLGIPFWIIAFTGLLRGSLPLYERHLNHALFFLLFPIIFELVPKKHFTREKLGLYFSILKNACLVVCLGYIAAFFYYHSPAEFFQSSYNVSAFRNFVYLEIGFFKMHPTYFSAILFFCIALCFDRVLRQKKFYELVYIAVFTLLTFLLLVRINTVFIVLMIPGMILFRSGLRKRTKTLSIAFFSLVLIGFIAFTPG